LVGSVIEVELSLAQEALKMEQYGHFKLRTAIELVYDALRVIQVCPRASLLWSHLRVTFEWARTQVKEALHLGV
jgi:hypothetical protein